MHRMRFPNQGRFPCLFNTRAPSFPCLVHPRSLLDPLSLRHCHRHLRHILLCPHITPPVHLPLPLHYRRLGSRAQQLLHDIANQQPSQEACELPLWTRAFSPPFSPSRLSTLPTASHLQIPILWGSPSQSGWVIDQMAVQRQQKTTTMLASKPDDDLPHLACSSARRSWRARYLSAAGGFAARIV